MQTPLQPLIMSDILDSSNTSVKTEVFIQLLYSSESEEVQALKCTPSIRKLDFWRAFFTNYLCEKLTELHDVLI